MSKKDCSPKYSDEDLKKALSQIAAGEKVYTVSKETQIPRTTLRRKMENNLNLIEPRGRKVSLTPEDEQALVKYIITNCERGRNPTMREIMDTVKRTLDKLDRKVFKGDNKPTYSWLHGFLSRHPRLKMKPVKSYVSQAASNVTESGTKAWFQGVSKGILEEYGEEGMAALRDPKRNYNQDESGFATNPDDHSLHFTFDNQVVKIKMFGNEKVNYSINLTTCADGSVLRTLLLLPFIESVPTSIRDNINLQSFDFIGGSGYETQASFAYYLEWVKNVTYAF
jgi:hypothetical protein